MSDDGFTEIPLERAQAFGKLVTAARDWRGGLVPNTSTGLWGPTKRLLEALSAFDRAPCDHPRSWRVFSSQSADADEVCGYCGASLVPGYTAPEDHEDPEGDALESSYARHPSTQDCSSPPES